MAGWDRHQGMPVHLPLDNIDTDQLIPARFMSVPRAEGYGAYLMHDLRRDADGALHSAFPLNACNGASILITGRNFGSGSSREAAVYALVDGGFVAVIAPSFGDIFAANAVNNGLLPAQLSETDIARLDAKTDITIDLKTRSITQGQTRLFFELNQTWQEKLINGWDDIDLTLQHADQIATYRAARRPVPGAWPTADRS